MSKALATAAIPALTDKNFVKTAGYCQKWIRQLIMKTYGTAKYKKYFEKYMGASAVETMNNFKNSPYAVPVKNGSMVGDILYKGNKTSGKYGHVGVRIPGNKVAENSSSHVGPGDNDARGIRSLSAYGDFELIVRLPEPSELK